MSEASAAVYTIKTLLKWRSANSTFCFPPMRLQRKRRKKKPPLLQSRECRKRILPVNLRSASKRSMWIRKNKKLVNCLLIRSNSLKIENERECGRMGRSPFSPIGEPTFFLSKSFAKMPMQIVFPISMVAVGVTGAAALLAVGNRMLYHKVGGLRSFELTFLVA